MGEGTLKQSPAVFYACGTDHADKCELYQNGISGVHGVVVVPRQGDKVKKEKPPLVFYAEPAEGEVASFSSTKVRSAIAAKDYDYIATSMSASVAEFLLMQAEEYDRFPSDASVDG